MGTVRLYELFHLFYAPIRSEETQRTEQGYAMPVWAYSQCHCRTYHNQPRAKHPSRAMNCSPILPRRTVTMMCSCATQV